MPNPQKGIQTEAAHIGFSTLSSSLPFPALRSLKTSAEFKEVFYIFLHSVLLEGASENHSCLYPCYTAHLECVELVWLLEEGLICFKWILWWGVLSVFFVRTSPLPSRKQYLLGYFCMILCGQLFHSPQVDWQLNSAKTRQDLGASFGYFHALHFYSAR